MKILYPTKKPIALQMVLLLAVILYNFMPGNASVAYAAPGNDNFASAKSVNTIPFTESYSVATATVESGEPTVNVLCDGKLLKRGTNTVWYKYIPATSGLISVDTVGSDYDTYLAVWRGTALNNLILVGCDDDNDLGYSSQLSPNLTAGVTYYIQVAKFNGIQGYPDEPACSASVPCNLTFNIKNQTFADVPPTHPYFQYIEALYAAGLTAGCATSPLRYCPADIMNRAQIAVFTVRAQFGVGYTPPPATHIFADDWSPGLWAEKWAEAMYHANLTAGCTTSGPLKYCPWQQTPREQAAVFGLKLKYGYNYAPPPATGTVFADMTNPSYYATKWAEQAYADGLIPACGTSGGKPLFCPTALVDRGLGAYIVAQALGLLGP